MEWSGEGRGGKQGSNNASGGQPSCDTAAGGYLDIPALPQVAHIRHRWLGARLVGEGRVWRVMWQCGAAGAEGSVNAFKLPAFLLMLQVAAGVERMTCA